MTLILSRTSGSVVNVACPLTRNVSSNPGMMNNSPTLGLATMFARLSSRLLPGRSGIARVRSSRILTKPTGSPRGLTSAFPSVFWVPRQTKGARRIKAWACWSSASRHFTAARSWVGANRRRSDGWSVIAKAGLILKSVMLSPFGSVPLVQFVKGWRSAVHRQDILLRGLTWHQIAVDSPPPGYCRQCQRKARRISSPSTSGRRSSTVRNSTARLPSIRHSAPAIA